MPIQPFPQPRIKFLDPVRFDSPYRYPIFAMTMPLGVLIGKYAARYIRDHDFHRLAHSNSLVMRNVYRIYNYLFPIGSGRRYFIEVALLDNLFTALHMEVHLHTMMPYPIPREGNHIEEVILSIARVCFLSYFINKIRQIFYRVLRMIPHPIPQVFAITLAPTGVYFVEAPSGRRNGEFRN
ncbi:MAG: hypothetical protein LBC45_02905 [Chlamydiales bacterium]|nr:hypothetical protein [Chlamydiales bacterium]